jgi:hypothetical protein
MRVRNQSVREAATFAAVAFMLGFSALELSAQTGEEHLANARRSYDAADLEGARAALDRAVAALEPRASQDPTARAQLLAAYELRARTRFNLTDQAGATLDLQTLLRYKPDYRVPTDVSPKLVQLFDEVRRSTVAEIVLLLTPANADVTLDGEAATGKTGRIAIAAGTHKVIVSRPGFKTLERNFTIDSGAAQELTIALDRSSATVELITHPVGVEVYVNSTRRGETSAGEPKAEMADIARRLNVPVTEVSTAFLISDLPVGRHTFEFKRLCFSPETRYLDIARLDDIRLDPVSLKPAFATLQLEGTPSSGATAFVDDVPRGAAPRTLGDICEGAHPIELRSPYGRLVRRLELRAGEQKTVSGSLKPAFAILSVSGLPEGLRGAGDLRISVESALADASSVAIFAPRADRAQQALTAQRLSADWLAFDRAGLPLKEAAKNITPKGRQDLSAELARAVEA